MNDFATYAAVAGEQLEAGFGVAREHVTVAVEACREQHVPQVGDHRRWRALLFVDREGGPQRAERVSVRRRLEQALARTVQ